MKPASGDDDDEDDENIFKQLFRISYYNDIVW